MSRKGSGRKEDSNYSRRHFRNFSWQAAWHFPSHPDPNPTQTFRRWLHSCFLIQKASQSSNVRVQSAIGLVSLHCSNLASQISKQAHFSKQVLLKLAHAWGSPRQDWILHCSLHEIPWIACDRALPIRMARTTMNVRMMSGDGLDCGEVKPWAQFISFSFLHIFALLVQDGQSTSWVCRLFVVMRELLGWWPYRRDNITQWNRKQWSDFEMVYDKKRLKILSSFRYTVQ